jgi:hypothetical protein
MAIRLDRNPNKLLNMLLKVGEKTLMLSIPIFLLGQCASDAVRDRKIDQALNRDVIVQVGRDREMMVGQKISEAENREQFIADFFNSISWVKRTSPEFQAKCKAIAKERKNVPLFKQCGSGLDPGATTPYGKFSSQVYAYQHLIAPEALEAIMAWILKLKPQGYDLAQSQDSRSMKITNIGTAEPFSDGKNGKEMRTPVELEFTESQGPTITRKLKNYYWIYTRPIAGSSKNAARTPFSDAVDATQKRGLYLTRILPYTNTSL